MMGFSFFILNTFKQVYSQAAKTIKRKQKQDGVLIPNGGVMFAACGSMFAKHLEAGRFEMKERNILLNCDSLISQSQNGACKADTTS